MIILIKFITFLVGSIILINTIRGFFFKKNYNIIVYPSFVFYFFNYIPLILDVIFGHPSYDSKFYGFIISHDNPTIETLYCLIITYIMVVFRSFQKRYFYEKRLTINPVVSNLLFIISILGMLLYILPYMFESTVWNVIINYEIWYHRDEIFNEIKFYSTFIILLSLFLLIIEENRKTFWIKFTLLIPFIYLGFLMNGKRNIVFIFFVGLIYILLTNRIIKRSISYFILVPIILFSLFTYSSWYQDHFQRSDGETFEENYASYRVNFGRDDTAKMVLYSEIYSDNKILDYTGESLLFYITFFIPRDIWEEKPLPYANYFTSSLLGYDEARLVGWTMTTSMLDELVSNFGIIIGSLLTPFIYIILCRIGMKYSQGIIGNIILALSIFLAIMISTVHLAAYISVLYLIVLCLFLYKIINKKRLKKIR